MGFPKRAHKTDSARRTNAARAALIAQFIPAGARVYGLDAPVLAHGCVAEKSLGKADVVVLGTPDPVLLARAARSGCIIVVSARPREEGGELGYYELTQLFDRFGYRIETSAQLEGKTVFRLAPADKIIPLASISILVIAANESEPDRLGLQMLRSVLPGKADLHPISFDALDRARGRYDLVIIGAGNALRPIQLSDALIAITDRAPAAIGIFGTSHRELIPRRPLTKLIERLDRWYARDAEDVLMYGRDRPNVTHLGDWLTDATLPAVLAQDPLRSTIVCDRAALLSAIDTADTVAYEDKTASGEFRSLLVDIFGRGYPPGEHFLVDADAVRRYRARVQVNVADLRADIEKLLTPRVKADAA